MLFLLTTCVYMAAPIMYIRKLCEALSARKNITLKLITTNANGTEDLPVKVGEETIVDGLPVIYFKIITGDPHETSPALGSYLFTNANQYDIVHIHTRWNLVAVISVFICVIKRKKFIVSPRGMLSQYILDMNNPK